MLARHIALALIALAVGVGAVGCGDDDETDTTTTEATTTTETTTDETTTETTTAAGREIFVGNCGSCHTLSDAGTTGTIGPSLDATTLDVAAIEAQVRSGGGGMPAFQDQLSEEEITAVAAYVAEPSG